MFRRALLGVIAGLFLTGVALAQDAPLFRGAPFGLIRRLPALPPPPADELPPPPLPRGGGPPPAYADLLPPRAIIGSLFRRGYRDVEIKRVRGGSYIVVAGDQDGGRVLIVVDGRTTEITGLRRIGWDHPPRQWSDDDWSPPRPWSGPRW
ncbi:hypothetical protein [Labrys monachus]|uniref:Uncharacterized protein n=1 Tax=Labrys monachus TaxID=217067 RepID=A0ABU0FNG4_9HYPH|nr:hypothetical protein [Labrys monachus]MDQ0396154.1 hypothetical protein [Labrys monachus]